MKPSQIAMLVIISVIGLSELGPKVVELVGTTNKVKVGEVWCCRLYGTLVGDSQYEITQNTMRKVINVDGSEITYVIANDTTKYVMDVDEFTFNGKGMTTYRVKE